MIGYTYNSLASMMLHGYLNNSLRVRWNANLPENTISFIEPNKFFRIIKLSFNKEKEEIIYEDHGFSLDEVIDVKMLSEYDYVIEVSHKRDIDPNDKYYFDSSYTFKFSTK